MLAVGVSFIAAFLFWPIQTHAVEPMTQQELLDLVEQLSKEGHVYEVIPDGSGDFSTIQTAVDQVRSGDTLLIYPGIYHETVTIEDKTVNLVGVYVEDCIIETYATEYNAAPLSIGSGIVCNLTIRAILPEQVDIPVQSIFEGILEASKEDIYAWQNRFLGYAVHIDQENINNKEVYFKNCRVVSESNYCMGIGLHANQHVTIEQCDLIALESGGCIYFHNTWYPEYCGESFFTVKNCTLKNYKSPYLITAHSFGESNPVSITFQNVSVSTVAYEWKKSYNDTNICTGLTIDDLNAMNSSQLTHFTLSQTQKYFKSFDNYIHHSLQELPQLKEGITYLEISDDDDPDYDKKEESEYDQHKKRTIIDIYNYQDGIGDGWCGLYNMYLTPESYGNTIQDMNYSSYWEEMPRKVDH